MTATAFFKRNMLSLRQCIKVTTCPAPDVWGEADGLKDAVKEWRGVPLSQHTDLFYPATGIEPNNSCATRGRQRLLEKNICVPQLLAFH